MMPRADQIKVDAPRAFCEDMAAQCDEVERGGPFPLRPGTAAPNSSSLG
jgi:hypothetical protein